MADEIVVQTSDVQVLHEALNTAYHKSLSEDHTEAYRKLTPDNSNPNYFKSRLTLLLENALQKADALIELSKDEPIEAIADDEEETE